MTKKRVPLPLARDQYRAAINKLGLAQVPAGEWLDVAGRTGQRYARSGTRGPAAKLIKLAIGLGLTPDEVDEIISKVKL